MNIYVDLINIKKNILFIIYILFNIFLICTLFIFDYGYLYVSFFVFGGHVRDTIAIIIVILKNVGEFMINTLYKKRFDSVKPLNSTSHENLIYSLVPVYNEDADMVTKNLDSLVAQRLPSGTVNVIILIFDGVTDKNKDLFDSINNLVVYNEETGNNESINYYSWKNSDKCKMIHREGIYKGLRIIVARKLKNKGKKDSLIVGEKLISEMYSDEHEIIFSHGQETSNGNAFIYHTDGDTVADENCIGELLLTMLNDEKVDAVSALIRVYKRDGLQTKAWAFSVMQDFQYFYSLMIRRNAESVFSATTCLPGCSNLVRMNTKSERAVNKYKNTPTDAEGLLQTVTRMQGTDRRYTTLLMREGGNLKMNYKAFVFTEPPLDVGSFIRQRRRWSSNSFFNSITMLYSGNVHPYVKFSSFIDVCRMFSTIFRLFSYVVFWYLFDGILSTVNLVMIGIFLVFPYFYCFLWAIYIVPNWFSMVLGFIMNKIFMPILSVTSISKMYMTATNFDWGFKPSSVSEEIIDEEEEEKEENKNENDMEKSIDSKLVTIPIDDEIDSVIVTWKGKKWEMTEVN